MAWKCWITVLCLALGTLGAVPEGPGRDCPPVHNVFDLAPLPDCQLAARLVDKGLCSPLEDSLRESCCFAARYFIAQGCRCWPGPFGPGVLAAAGSVASACGDTRAVRAAQHDLALGQTPPVPAEGRPVEWSVVSSGDGKRTSGSGGDGSATTNPRREKELTITSDPVALTPIRLTVGVLSSAGRRDRRAAVRSTWGSDPGISLLRFFIARPVDDDLMATVEQEAAAYNDIILLRNVTESYWNITHQTLALLRYAAADDTNQAPTHVLKTDDDSYVRVSALLDAVRTRIPSGPGATATMMGFVENPGGGPHRDPTSRWYVSRDEWPGETYPPWAHGVGILLTADLARAIVADVDPAGPLFKLEDVALGQWVVAAASSRHWTINYIKDTRFNFDGCSFGDIISHKISPARQYCLWTHSGRCSACSEAVLARRNRRRKPVVNL